MDTFGNIYQASSMQKVRVNLDVSIDDVMTWSNLLYTGLHDDDVNVVLQEIRSWQWEFNNIGINFIFVDFIDV